MQDRPIRTPLEAFLALRKEVGPISDAETGYLAKRPFDSTSPSPEPDVAGPPADGNADDIPFGTRSESSAPVGPLEGAYERMRQLEKALGEAIDYLQRLPRHPETFRVRDELTQVLEGSGLSLSRRPLVGESFLPSGVPMLGVELHGLDLYISSHTKKHDEDLQLLELLRRGEYLVRLAAPTSPVLSELEAQYAERRSGRTA